ncbi:MAG: hypothetical protein HY866_14770 [Chloroflexi bacterium]|nr:hypothetical protein [Chloroflexota bacterium]
MADILFVVLCIFVFIFAGIIYWRVLRVLFWLIQIAGFVAGIGTGLAVKDDDGLFWGLIAGTAVYLAVYSLVLMWNRIINLEREVVRLGGKPNTPKFLGWFKGEPDSEEKAKRE